MNHLRLLGGVAVLIISSWHLVAQERSHTIPVPVEVFFGNEQLYFQLVVKRRFSLESRFSYFTVATYSATYDQSAVNSRASITIPVQFSYEVGSGFGIMAGTDINSEGGFSAIAGPQHSYASRKFLAVTVASVFLNEDRDFKIFGLYEYTPPINDTWSLYSRLQFIYNHSWKQGLHNKSYLYLRTGIQKGPVIFGLAANLEQSGPEENFDENYGIFMRYEFN